MRVSARSWVLAASASLGLATPASAGQNGLFLPAPPTGPGGEDSIETSSGTRCRQSMNSNGAYVDLGVMGSAAAPPSGKSQAFVTDTRDREATAYARVTIPLGRKPKRLDCDSVYQLEIQRLQREVELLKMAAQ
jgi:hypothetical protein